MRKMSPNSKTNWRNLLLNFIECFILYWKCHQNQCSWSMCMMMHEHRGRLAEALSSSLWPRVIGRSSNQLYFAYSPKSNQIQQASLSVSTYSFSFWWRNSPNTLAERNILHEGVADGHDVQRVCFAWHAERSGDRNPGRSATTFLKISHLFWPSPIIFVETPPQSYRVIVMYSALPRIPNVLKNYFVDKFQSATNCHRSKHIFVSVCGSMFDKCHYVYMLPSATMYICYQVPLYIYVTKCHIAPLYLFQWGLGKLALDSCHYNPHDENAMTSFKVPQSAIEAYIWGCFMWFYVLQVPLCIVYLLQSAT